MAFIRTLRPGDATGAVHDMYARQEDHWGFVRIHGFTDAEVFDIAAIAAGRCFFTKLLDALGAEPDVAFMAMDAQLRQELGAGRPISHARPEYSGSEPTAIPA